jgi:hypothetical protein
MVFDMEMAKKIKKHYISVIGSDLSTGIIIDYILIAPVDVEMYSRFIRNFQLTKNNEDSLRYSGFDTQKVRVYVVNDFNTKGSFRKLDIDIFLTEKGIKKIY